MESICIVSTLSESICKCPFSRCFVVAVGVAMELRCIDALHPMWMRKMQVFICTSTVFVTKSLTLCHLSFGGVKRTKPPTRRNRCCEQDDCDRDVRPRKIRVFFSSGYVHAYGNYHMNSYFERNRFFLLFFFGEIWISADQFFSHPFLTSVLQERFGESDKRRHGTFPMRSMWKHRNAWWEKGHLFIQTRIRLNGSGCSGGYMECERKSVNAVISVSGLLTFITNPTRGCSHTICWPHFRHFWFSWRLNYLMLVTNTEVSFWPGGAIYLMRNFIIIFRLNPGSLDQIRRICHFHAVYVSFNIQ